MVHISVSVQSALVVHPGVCVGVCVCVAVGVCVGVCVGVEVSTTMQPVSGSHPSGQGKPSCTHTPPMHRSLMVHRSASVQSAFTVQTARAACGTSPHTANAPTSRSARMLRARVDRTGATNSAHEAEYCDTGSRPGSMLISQVHPRGHHPGAPVYYKHGCNDKEKTRCVTSGHAVLDPARWNRLTGHRARR